MTVLAVHQPQYLPWVPYFDKADSCDVFVYLDTVQFQKNGVQNRNQVKTSIGATWLTVPVNASLSCTIQHTRIVDRRWNRKHILTIQQSYRRAEFLSRFDEGLRQILVKDWEYLADLNIAVTEWMFGELGVGCQRIRASELDVTGSSDDLIVNIAKCVGANVYLSGTGAMSYQDESKFRRSGVRLVYQSYANQPYNQCHHQAGFIPDLSALDLMLNIGPSARNILAAGRTRVA